MDFDIRCKDALLLAILTGTTEAQRVKYEIQDDVLEAAQPSVPVRDACERLLTCIDTLCTWPNATYAPI